MPVFSPHGSPTGAVDEALRLGNHVGAQSTRRVGGIVACPARDRLPAWALRLLEGA